MKISTLFAVLYLLLQSCFSAPLLIAQNKGTGSSDSDESTSLKVMSFNIRYGSAKDGSNEWSKRKELVLKTIQQFDADIVGTQETLDFQAAYLSKQLPKFTYVGRARQAKGKGEHCGILFRSSRFQKLTEGHFWLSENPDRPGSKSWDSSLPRMATWLKLWDEENEGSFYILNTHFDHRGKIAREESAKLIARFVKDLPDDSRVVVVGDFNASVESAPYQTLFGKSENPGTTAAGLIDTFKLKNLQTKNDEGTFNGFNGKTNGARIDWIGVNSGFTVESAAIDRTEFKGRYPSDHFPVTAVIK